MYFGGVHGFNIFDPRRIPAIPRDASRVILTEFRIHGSSVPVRPGSVLPKPVGQMNELNLPPEDNGISFEFAALKFSDQARTRYRFILERLERQMDRSGQPEPLGAIHRSAAGRIPVSRSGVYGRQNLEQP